MGTITKEMVAASLRNVIDPEVGINVVDLGLIYEVWFGPSYLHVNMTMTTPTCPLGTYLTEEVRAALQRGFSEFTQVEVSLVWDPPWSPELMSAAAKAQLGWQHTHKEERHA